MKVKFKATKQGRRRNKTTRKRQIDIWAYENRCKKSNGPRNVNLQDSIRKTRKEHRRSQPASKIKRSKKETPEALLNVDPMSTSTTVVPMRIFKVPDLHEQTGALAKYSQYTIHKDIKGQLVQLGKQSGQKAYINFLDAKLQTMRKAGGFWDKALVTYVQGLLSVVQLTGKVDEPHSKLKMVARSLGSYHLKHENIINGLLYHTLFINYTLKNKLGKAYQCIMKAFHSIQQEKPDTWTSGIFHIQGWMYNILAHLKPAARIQHCKKGVYYYELAREHCRYQSCTLDVNQYYFIHYTMQIAYIALHMPTMYTISLFARTDIVLQHGRSCTMSIRDVQFAEEQINLAKSKIPTLSSKHRYKETEMVLVGEIYLHLRKAQLSLGGKSSFEQCLASIMESRQKYKEWCEKYQISSTYQKLGKLKMYLEKLLNEVQNQLESSHAHCHTSGSRLHHQHCQHGRNCVMRSSEDQSLYTPDSEGSQSREDDIEVVFSSDDEPFKPSTYINASSAGQHIRKRLQIRDEESFKSSELRVSLPREVDAKHKNGTLSPKLSSDVACHPDVTGIIACYDSGSVVPWHDLGSSTTTCESTTSTADSESGDCMEPNARWNESHLGMTHNSAVINDTVQSIARHTSEISNPEGNQLVGEFTSIQLIDAERQFEDVDDLFDDLVDDIVGDLVNDIFSDVVHDFTGNLSFNESKHSTQFCAAFHSGTLTCNRCSSVDEEEVFSEGSSSQRESDI